MISINALGLSQSANGNDLAAVQIHLDEQSFEITHQRKINKDINALQQIIHSSRYHPEVIGFFPDKRLSMDTTTGIKEILNNLNLPVYYDFENNNESYLFLIKNGLIIDRYNLNTYCYKRLLLNLAERLYDTPVDIQGKIIPLGTYSALLDKKLRALIPTINHPWMQPEDDALAIAILRYALRRRIEEPDILSTYYTYLISIIAECFSFTSDRFYIVGTLSRYSWFVRLFSLYFKEAKYFINENLIFQQAFLAGVLSGLALRISPHISEMPLKQSSEVNYAILLF